MKLTKEILKVLGYTVLILAALAIIGLGSIWAAGWLFYGMILFMLDYPDLVFPAFIIVASLLLVSIILMIISGIKGLVNMKRKPYNLK